jgi:hypothetical protein
VGQRSWHASLCPVVNTVSQLTEKKIGSLPVVVTLWSLQAASSRGWQSLALVDRPLSRHIRRKDPQTPSGPTLGAFESQTQVVSGRGLDRLADLTHPTAGNDWQALWREVESLPSGLRRPQARERELFLISAQGSSTHLITVGAS